jgi:branched-chain amino acid transport system permease protein
MIGQILVDGLVVGATVALVAVGFGLCYRLTGFFNFSHAISVVVGPYCILVITQKAQLPDQIAWFIGVALSCALGGWVYLLVFRPMRRRSATVLSLMLASLGVYVLLQNLISILFGDETQSLSRGPVEEGWHILGGVVTHIQACAVVVAAVSLGAICWFLERTPAGVRVRAVASDPDLAVIEGIRRDVVELCAFAGAAGLASMSGILIAMDVGFEPTMGLGLLMKAVVAVIVGGVRRPIGIVAGAMLVALSGSVGAWFLGAEWKEAIAFLLFLGFLLARPKGLVVSPR